MSYATDERVAVLGAAGAIGSNLAQSLLQLGVTGNVTMYDPFEPGLEGAAEDLPLRLPRRGGHVERVPGRGP